MRILVHTIFYRPELTGIAKYTSEMCEWLVERGHTVEVICPPPYYPHWTVQAPYRQWQYTRERLSGVEIIRCPLWVSQKPSGVRRILYECSFAFSSFFACVTRLWNPPDAIFVLEPSLLNAIPSLLLAKTTGALSWLQVKDFEIDIAFELGQIRGRGLQRLAKEFERFIMLRFDVVSTISQSMMAKLQEKGIDGDKAVYFPDWVNTNQVRPLTGTNRLRPELEIPDGRVVALFSGTLGAKQGLETLIAAAEILDRQDDSPFFLICGDGPAKTRLETLASNLRNVKFIPLQPADRLNDLLNLADFHVLPQVPEVASSVLPSKILGMLASGRPVLATVTADSEIGKMTEHCGLLTPPGNAQALADSAMKLAADPELREQLGAAARECAISTLHHAGILENFELQLLKRLGEASYA